MNIRSTFNQIIVAKPAEFFREFDVTERAEIRDQNEYNKRFERDCENRETYGKKTDQNSGVDSARPRPE